MERLVETIRKAKEAQAELTAEAERTAAANINRLRDQKLVRDISPEIAQMEKLRNEAEGMADLMQRIGASGGAGSLRFWPPLDRQWSKLRFQPLVPMRP